VLISEEAPHMFLHRALRKSVPKEVLGKIVHARLLRVSLQQHIFEAFSMPTVTSAYVNSLVSQYGEQEQHTIAKVKHDIGYAMTLLSHTFNSLRRLDINLDIVDYIHNPCHTAAENIPRILAEDIHDGTNRGPLLLPLATLRHMKSISLVDIRVLWVDFLGSRRPSGYDLCDVTVQNFQQIMIEALKKRIPAKSITGHA
jgi:predicted hydrolase (HD superfamily)